MGVEYCHYLIPRPNSFRPSAEQLAGLVEAWSMDHWIAAPDSDALKKMALINGIPYEEAADIWAHIRLSPGFASVPRSLTPEWFREQMAGDLKLEFPVDHGDQIGLQYPLISDSGPPHDPYYEIQIHLSGEYVQHASELIGSEEIVCACGESLEFAADPDVFYASRIRIQCPRCSAVFDPSSVRVMVRDGWTGEKSWVSGGTIYRFAIVIDCGKCIPERKDAPIRANAALVELCQKVLGHEFYGVGDLY